ncbi:hypothetical protein, partial [Caldanaerobacter sp.]|uniref:hypothetical protein n=1 Tax=Caldanaerobacter sp. TaxID=2930036 RepID=UPI003C7530D4
TSIPHFPASSPTEILHYHGQLEENVVIYKRKKPLSGPVRLARSYKKKYRKPSCQCKKVFLEVVG